MINTCQNKVCREAKLMYEVTVMVVVLIVVVIVVEVAAAAAVVVIESLQQKVKID